MTPNTSNLALFLAVVSSRDRGHFSFPDILIYLWEIRLVILIRYTNKLLTQFDLILTQISLLKLIEIIIVIIIRFSFPKAIHFFPTLLSIQKNKK